jgi:ankyrin repeat protein
MALAIIRCGRADLEIKTPAGDTPTHLALTACSTESVRALIHGKANLDIPDAASCVPLHRAAYMACEARNPGAEERAVLLVKGVVNGLVSRTFPAKPYRIYLVIESNKVLVSVRPKPRFSIFGLDFP